MLIHYNYVLFLGTPNRVLKFLRGGKMNFLTLNLLTSLVLVSTSMARTASVTECQDAGGFYGNIKIESRDKLVQITAAQGYAYEITQALGAKPNQEASQLSLRFHANQCLILFTGLQCQGLVSVTSETFSNNKTTFQALANLKLDRLPKKTRITLSLRLSEYSKPAEASHVFESPLGQCILK
jgi:hypothetical protein